MSAPKSVIKLQKKDGRSEVEYTSSVDACTYYLFELSRAALRDVAKVVKKKAQEQFYREFRRITGRNMNANAINTKVWASRNTQYPRLQIGLSQKGLTRWFFFQEIGTSKTPRKAILTKTVEENVAEIVKIESQYLSGLSGEASALEAKIDESEYED